MVETKKRERESEGGVGNAKACHHGYEIISQNNWDYMLSSVKMLNFVTQLFSNALLASVG